VPRWAREARETKLKEADVCFCNIVAQVKNKHISMMFRFFVRLPR